MIKMNEWYETLWGIIVLGCFGSVLGTVFLNITVIVLNKVGPRLFFTLVFKHFNSIRRK